MFLAIASTPSSLLVYIAVFPSWKTFIEGSFTANTFQVWSSGVYLELGMDSNFKTRFNFDCQELESIIKIQTNLFKSDIHMGQCY